MDGEELAYAGAARQAELIRAGEVSSRELVELYLERIERLNPRLNAFAEVLAERALAEADAADARRAAGDAPPLLGVPVAIKDNVDVEGAATRFGSRGYDDSPATVDGEIVTAPARRGRRDPRQDHPPGARDPAAFTETEGWGEAAQPVGLRSARSGGSSGGSAAAVAAGLAGAASATDGGGSIRIPAAFCGLFGLKPQRGRVPIEPHDHWNELSAAGCVTRTVADTALWLDAVDGRRRRPRWAAGARALVRRGRGVGARTGCGSRSPSEPARAILPPTSATRSEAGLAETEELLRSLGHDVRRHEPSLRAGGQQLRRPLPRRRSTTRSARSRTPSGSRRARAASAGSAAPTRRRSRAAPTRAAAADAAKINRSWDELRRPGHADRRRAGGRGRPLGGQGRDADAARHEPGLLLHPDLEPHRPAGGGDPGRLHRRPGCRARSPWSAAPPTSRPCSRSPPRSRPSAAGPTAAHRSPRSSVAAARCSRSGRYPTRSGAFKAAPVTDSLASAIRTRPRSRRRQSPPSVTLASPIDADVTLDRMRQKMFRRPRT